MILAIVASYAVFTTALIARHYWRSRHWRRLTEALAKGEGFVASSMTVETMESERTETEAERRREYRASLAALLEDAGYALTEAQSLGRRTDCLGTAESAIRGALQNVCMEDGVLFVEDGVPDAPVMDAKS